MKRTRNETHHKRLWYTRITLAVGNSADINLIPNIVQTIDICAECDIAWTLSGVSFFVFVESLCK